jgi:hypothetical protein
MIIVMERQLGGAEDQLTVVENQLGGAECQLLNLVAAKLQLLAVELRLLGGKQQPETAGKQQHVVAE